jgi:predicted NBD/HSP70 family sugar kinase
MSNRTRTKVVPLRAGRSGGLEPFPFPVHGGLTLPTAHVDSYNLDIRYRGQRLAACANKRALKMAIEKWRKLARLPDGDPLGTRHGMAITKKQLDAALASEDHDARCIVHGAIEDFARSLALLTERFLVVQEWQQTECIVVGGGLRASDTGELIVRRAQALLDHRGVPIALRPISNHPHDAALIGAAHLAPSWMLAGHDAIVAADIGGTNVRIGVVRLNRGKEGDLSEARVWKRILWRHADESVGRDEVVRTIGKAMSKLIRKADDKGLRLAPYIGVACPGLISADGSIGKGSEVLPGNWRSPHFNLPSQLMKAIPTIGGHRTLVALHNDAVVQGLSEIPFLDRQRRWGIFTVGTGLGNARFTRHDSSSSLHRGVP